MVASTTGQALKGSNGASATIGKNLAYISTPNVDIMAGFSSQGPTDVDFRVKPDVVAPGVNVLSSIPHTFCDTPPCFAFFQGTSMATPHLAGSAAVVRGQHPDWSAAEVRSAIVNTAADKQVLKNFRTGAVETDANVVGAGRENLLSAAGARVALDPVSVSFGAVPSGAGQTKTVAVTLTNISGVAQTFGLAVEPGSGGVSYSLSTSSVSLAGGGSATVTVTLTADKGATAGDHQARLTIGAGGNEVAHAVVYTLVQ
jgi:subtilisin family serine protease